VQQQFKTALLEGVEKFLTHCLEVNLEIQEEPAFADLKMVYENLQHDSLSE